MKLVSYGQMGFERGGVLVGDQVYDLHNLLNQHGSIPPVSDNRKFLETPNWRSLLEQLLPLTKSATPIDVNLVRLGSPIPLSLIHI